jgi:hypothetical protein
MVINVWIKGKKYVLAGSENEKPRLSEFCPNCGNETKTVYLLSTMQLIKNEIARACSACNQERPRWV